MEVVKDLEPHEKVKVIGGKHDKKEGFYIETKFLVLTRDTEILSVDPSIIVADEARPKTAPFKKGDLVLILANRSEEEFGEVVRPMGDVFEVKLFGKEGVVPFSVKDLKLIKEDWSGGGGGGGGH